MTKQYESALAPLLEQYLQWRSSIGFDPRSHRSLLRSLDEYAALCRADPRDLTPLFLLEFRRSPGASASTRNRKMSASRSFCQFLVRRRILQDNPARDIPSEKESAFAPAIFSPEQTEELLRSAEKAIRKERKWFFGDLSAYTAILLMASCGLRISEPLRLTPDNYDREEGSLYIEKTKFYKDRLIPLPGACLAHMENYLSARKALAGKSEEHCLLLKGGGSALRSADVYTPFRRAVKSTGVWKPKREIADTVFGAPTPHSLRHSFAVNTLKRIRQKGGCPRKMLPVLSVYMGHRKYRYTAVYLKFLDAEQRSNLVDFSIERQEDI